MDLLLPRYLLKSRIPGLQYLDVDSISKIATEFSISFTATAIRLVKLGIATAMIVSHRPERRKWFVRGPDVADDLYIKAELDYNSSAFEIVYTDKRQARPQQVKASTWFNGRLAEQYLIREEALKISEDQTLIILNIGDRAMVKSG